MKTLFAALAFLFASQTFAADRVAVPAPLNTPGPLKFEDPGVGTLLVRVIDMGEPIQLTISVKCVDRRTKKTAVVPRLEFLVKDEALCDYRPHEWDEKNKVLVIHGSSYTEGVGQNQCEDHWKQKYTIKEICASWGP